MVLSMGQIITWWFVLDDTHLHYREYTIFHTCRTPWRKLIHSSFLVGNISERSQRSTKHYVYVISHILNANSNQNEGCCHGDGCGRQCSPLQAWQLMCYPQFKHTGLLLRSPWPHRVPKTKRQQRLASGVPTQSTCLFIFIIIIQLAPLWHQLCERAVLLV